MNVGDYVRTKDGIILKVKDIEDIYTTDNIYIGMAIYDNEGHFVNDVEIIKSSSNIIDLIEVGDYVNGYKVTMLEDEYYDDVTDSVKKIKDKEKIKIILGNEEQFYGVYAKDIKSIVTKEQFESMEYKVGE